MTVHEDSIPDLEEEHPDGRLNRRSFLTGVGGAAVLGLGLNVPEAFASSLRAPKGVKLTGLYRDLNEENFFRINDGVQYGARLFAHKSAQPLIYHNNSTTEQAVIQGALASLPSGWKLALNAWDNTEESALTIAHMLKNKGYFVTQWNKPAHVFPWNIGPQWVAHIQFDSFGAEVANMAQVAKQLNGTGGICYVQGLMTTTNAQQHWLGVQTALKKYPGIKLLDVQPGNWDRTTAFNLAQTWLTRYGSKVNAICSANDEMSLGILQAVRAAGRAGQVAITGGDGVHEAVVAVKNGDFTATIQFDSYWQGAVGMGLAYKAAIGQLNPNKLSHAHRAFNGPFYVVTKANANKYLQSPNPLNYNFHNLWALAQSQVKT
jgi:ribose transport system substrate-binding protein